MVILANVPGLSCCTPVAILQQWLTPSPRRIAPVPRPCGSTRTAAHGDAEAILIIIVSDYEIQHLGEAIPEDWAPRLGAAGGGRLRALLAGWEKMVVNGMGFLMLPQETV
eukprot:Skav209691  [mRNA]  locus=scaffold36:3652:4805:+ [translate_table: standard]